ncbi:hypothetical protein [Liquorilactobacillus vini]|nr:hypothetical protein [Liquorilactobacillus vini]
MQTVLKHAKIYTESSAIDDGYLRFDSQLIAVDPIEEYQPSV